MSTKDNWYQKAKRKDPNYSTSGARLAVDKLPEGLMARVHEHCKKNGLFVRHFVAQALELALNKRLGVYRERG